MKRYINNTLYYISKYNMYALVFMVLFFISIILFKTLVVSLVATTTVYFVLLKTKLIVIGSPWDKI